MRKNVLLQPSYSVRCVLCLWLILFSAGFCICSLNTIRAALVFSPLSPKQLQQKSGGISSLSTNFLWGWVVPFHLRWSAASHTSRCTVRIRHHHTEFHVQIHINTFSAWCVHMYMFVCICFFLVYVLGTGLKVEGLYRCCGTVTKISQLVEKLQMSPADAFLETDEDTIMNLTGAFKHFLRQNPEIIPTSERCSWVQAAGNKHNCVVGSQKTTTL